MYDVCAQIFHSIVMCVASAHLEYTAFASVWHDSALIIACVTWLDYTIMCATFVPRLNHMCDNHMCALIIALSGVWRLWWKVIQMTCDWNVDEMTHIYDTTLWWQVNEATTLHITPIHMPPECHVTRLPLSHERVTTLIHMPPECHVTRRIHMCDMTHA